MMKDVMAQMKIGLILLVLFTLLTGLIYPFAVTALAQLIFPWQANGSLIRLNDKVVGSLLIGQDFNEDKYFWGRPSATSPAAYNGASSSGSNLGPSNPDLLKAVKTRIEHLKASVKIPVDLVTASGSGLDPEISPLAAFYQASRIAKASKLSEVEINTLIQNSIQTRTFGILGEPRVNVLQLNIALDTLRSRSAGATTQS